jgi:hypothetical protein
MPAYLIPSMVVWAVVCLLVVVLFVRRKMVARKEDDTLHVLHGTLSEQTTVANQLEAIDRWGKILTLAAVVMGLLIAAAYVSDSFFNRPSMGA